MKAPKLIMAAALASAGVEGDGNFRTRVSGVSTIGTVDPAPCPAGAEALECCQFRGTMFIYGTNALNSDAQYSTPSRYMDHGIDVAIDEINAMCGVTYGGHSYALRYHRVDDKSDPLVAKAHAEALLARPLDGPDLNAFYVAPYSSSMCKEVNPAVSALGIASIAPGCSAQDVYTNNSNVFGVRVPATKLMLPTVDAYKALGAKSVATVVEKLLFTETVCSEIRNKTDEEGMEFKGETSLEASAQVTDEAIDEMVLKWKDDLADLIIGCTYETMCKRIIESMIKHDVDPKAMAFTECVGVETLNSALGKNIVGLSAGSPFPLEAGPSANLRQGNRIKNNQEFKEAYRLRTGHTEVPLQAAASYAGIKIMAHAIEGADSVVGNDVATFLSGAPVPTAFGDFSFDPTGQTKNEAVVLQYNENMELKIIYPPSKADAAGIYPRPKFSSHDSNNNGDNTSGGNGDNTSGGNGNNNNSSSNSNYETNIMVQAPTVLDYSKAIIGSVIGGMFLLGFLIAATVFAYGYFFIHRASSGSNNDNNSSI